jgi:hypothetical protein
MLPGRIIGNPPVSHESLCIMFQRDMSILEGVGGGGFSISADGSFQGMLQKGCIFYLCIARMSNSIVKGLKMLKGSFGLTRGRCVQ